MSIPNLPNNLIQQQQNIVINQGQLQHAIMTTTNNGIPIAVTTNAPISMDHQQGQQIIHMQQPTQTVQMQQHQLHQLIQQQQQQHQIQQQIQQQQQQQQVEAMETQQLSMPSMQVQQAQNTQVQPPQQMQQQQQQQSNASAPATSAQSKAQSSHSGTSGGGGNSSNNTGSETTQLITKSRMADLVKDIDPNITMEDDVEEILLNYVDEFVDRVLNGASMIAKHRHVNIIEVKDVQQYLNRNYSMWVPGLGTDELRPYKRSMTTESHKQRLALIRKALKKN